MARAKKIATTAKLEYYVVVDAVGNFAVGADEDACKEAYESNVQELADSGGYRFIKMRVTVPLPAELEVSLTVEEEELAPPAAAGEASPTVHANDDQVLATEQGQYFRETWCKLSREGACDVYGGMECDRVYREWKEAGSPNDLMTFIRRSANMVPLTRG